MSRRFGSPRNTESCREICASGSAATDRRSRCRAPVQPEDAISMYVYDDLDRTLVDERVREFRDQVGRRLSGELTEEEFKPLRLMNGVYLQLHAYMLRIGLSYGTLAATQMRTLAHVGRRSG